MKESLKKTNVKLIFNERQVSWLLFASPNHSKMLFPMFLLLNLKANCRSRSYMTNALLKRVNFDKEKGGCLTYH
jgi:hypothetical protein